MLLADLNISDERFDDAKAAALKAVAEIPATKTRASPPGACRLVDPAGAAAAELAAAANNPRPATFYAALGEQHSRPSQVPSAERAFLMACAPIRSAPDAPIGLGMLYMQVGRETETKSLFEMAFDADPFNKRARQHDEGAGAYGSYTSIDTPHSAS